jgi:hypothetical protein
MNSKHKNSSEGRDLRSVVFCLIATTAMLVPVIAAGASRGGGRMAQSSVSGANRSMPKATTGSVNAGNRANTGNVNTGNKVNTGNVNTGNKVNTGNVNTGNVNVGNDINVNIDADYGHGGYHGGYYHPVATGMVIGAVAVTTAAVMGSYYHTLPPSCTTVIKSGVSYHHCGSVYYQQTWSGNDVVYVVVNP